MSIQQLRYVAKAVEMGSYAEAARKLIVSPQTVSKAVLSAEKRYNLRLFENDGRGVKPTSLGRRFAEDARLVIDAYDGLIERYRSSMSAYGVSGLITIAVAESSLRGGACPERVLIELQRRFSSNVQVLRFQSDTCLRALENSLADACLIFGPCDQQNYTCKVLGRVRLVALVSESCPESTCNRLAAGNLERQTIALPEDIRYVLPELKKHFALHGLSVPRMTQIGSSESDLTEFLQGGGAILSTPDCRLEKDSQSVVRVRFLEHCPVFLPICFLARRSAVSEHLGVIAGFLQSSLGKDRPLSHAG